MTSIDFQHLLLEGILVLQFKGTCRTRCTAGMTGRRHYPTMAITTSSSTTGNPSRRVLIECPSDCLRHFPNLRSFSKKPLLPKLA